MPSPRKPVTSWRSDDCSRVSLPGRGAIGGELGPELARTVVSAENVPNPEPETSFAEVGLRLAALGDVRLGDTLSILALFETRLVPGTTTLALRQAGTVGEVPALWLGLGLGLSLRSR